MTSTSLPSSISPVPRHSGNNYIMAQFHSHVVASGCHQQQQRHHTIPHHHHQTHAHAAPSPSSTSTTRVGMGIAGRVGLGLGMGNSTFPTFYPPARIQHQGHFHFNNNTQSTRRCQTQSRTRHSTTAANGHFHPTASSSTGPASTPTSQNPCSTRQEVLRVRVCGSCPASAPVVRAQCVSATVTMSSSTATATAMATASSATAVVRSSASSTRLIRDCLSRCGSRISKSTSASTSSSTSKLISTTTRNITTSKSSKKTSSTSNSQSNKDTSSTNTSKSTTTRPTSSYKTPTHTTSSTTTSTSSSTFSTQTRLNTRLNTPTISRPQRLAQLQSGNDKNKDKFPIHHSSSLSSRSSKPISTAFSSRGSTSRGSKTTKTDTEWASALRRRREMDKDAGGWGAVPRHGEGKTVGLRGVLKKKK
ncbi:hypothetical protein EX30DRAFT_345886 [Ascodesmis nigricans]|uniref:Uncharacterized protein n=1 Tax=Ascodesmis nigricans TaxID=341454 RepID=A0A4S2N7Y4_9PEZI|nr:hypothetical protein EX30DRAFT_345886 [Ascodesmis nigricans]